jgi:acylphosphatase
MRCSENDSVIAKQVRITGRVQGVGFRDWLVTTARGLGLSGWVRNRSDGSVEAFFSGDAGAVDDCIRACRVGPRLAAVDQVKVSPAEATEMRGFAIRPTL